MKNKKKEGKKINSPYWIVVSATLFIATLIVLSTIKISIVDAAEWNKKAEGMWRLDSLVNIEPPRGNILAHDGTPLAETVPLYTVYIEFGTPNIDKLIYQDIVHPKGSNLPDTLKLDSLCNYLAEAFPVKTKAEYYSYISKKRDQKSNNCIVAVDISSEQLQDLMEFSVVANCRRGKFTGIVPRRSYKRFYPYDSLTSVVLGRASIATEDMLKQNPTYKRHEWHGLSGLELKLDTLLFGEHGKGERRQKHWGIGTYEVIAPKKGYDVVTTLDMTMQEIAQRNLMDMMKAQRAEYGTAIIMDVATGEIRAMANVEKTKNGKYTFKTRRNYAITAIEPGSVVKAFSMLMAMENGHIDPHREFNSEGAIPETRGYKSISYYRERLTPEKVIVMSDNRGICKLVGDIYRGRYNEYIRDIKKTGIMQTADLPLPGAEKPVIKEFAFKQQWEYFSFAQMIFGYNFSLAPISTLSVYNAIANNGRLMQPSIIKGYLRDGEPDSISPPVCLNEHLCTPEHAQQLKEMLHGVVYDPAGTAAKAIKNGRVEIAGKTGTAKARWERTKIIKPKGSISEDGTVLKKDIVKYESGYIEGMWRLAFAGFFPYDNPQYSCIVVIDQPRKNGAWAGGVAGGVFRAIAEEMYSRNLLDCDVEYSKNEEHTNPPRNILQDDSDEYIYNFLNQYPQPDTTAVHSDDSAAIQTVTSIEAVVPSVIGYTAQDALYELEQLGFVVEMEGMGRVVKQSIKAGIPLQKGMNMKLTLK